MLNFVETFRQYTNSDILLSLKLNVTSGSSNTCFFVLVDSTR